MQISWLLGYLMNIVLLVHKRLIPPSAPKGDRERAKWRTELDVKEALIRLGHQVDLIGLEDSLDPLIKAKNKTKPEIIFNLLEEFRGEAVFDQNVVAFMEMMGWPYTGCNSRGLALARDKATAKKIVSYHGIQTPRFLVIGRKQRVIHQPVGLKYPVIVKYLTEEASFGIGTKNVVKNDREFQNLVRHLIERFHSDLIVEEFIEGREFYVGVWGNDSPRALTPIEIDFGQLPPIKQLATAQLKWNKSYQKKHRIKTGFLKNEKVISQALTHTAIRCFKALRLTGYARLDFRLNAENEIQFIEANPNPQICRNEDFSDAVLKEGLTYDEMISQILKFGKRPHFDSVFCV